MSAESFKRKLTAILSADVKGYSRLMGENEAETVKTLTAYRKIMGELIQQHRGRVIDSPGDNILAEFGSVVDAVQCAVAAQNEFKARNAELPENRRMEFRVGVNLGDVIEEENRIYGDGVNIAARLESLADPGGICISKTAFDQIETKLPLGYEYLGDQTVKNIAKPVGAYRVLMDPRVTVAGAKAPKVPLWRHTTVLAGAIIVLLAVIGVGVWNSYFRAPPIEPASKEKMAFPLPDKPSIAVLPFVNMSDDPKQEYLGDGLSEDLITSLHKVGNLFVIARESSFSYKGKPVKVKQIAEELGVRYVLEGSVRHAEGKVRITAQLIDAIKGNHLWAERYDRELKDIFAMQDQITKEIITALQVQLKEGEEARTHARGTKSLEAYLRFLEARTSAYRNTKEDNARAQELIKQAINLDLNYAAAYMELSREILIDVFLGASKSPRESLMKAIESAKKAIELDNFLAGAHGVLGQLYTMLRQHERGIAEAQKAVDLDPSSSRAHFALAFTLNFAGMHEAAIPHFERAIRLNPFGPPNFWHHMAIAYGQTGQYDKAIAALKSALQREPKDVLAYTILTATYINAGHEEEGRATAAEVLKIDPNFSAERAAAIIPWKDPAKNERGLAAFRKAGLPDKPPLPLPDKPSIAVLPFVNMSDDKSQEYFSDGLTEEIITALSKTPKLFVIARNSAFVYKGKPVHVQQVSRELGVKYVLEGSVRRSGDQLRITAQLIEASTGKHLWSERYERPVGEIFAVQDDITLAIVRAMRVTLTSGEQARLIGKGTKNLEAYLKTIEANEQFYLMNRQGSLKAKELAKEAISQDSKYAFPYAVLALAHMLDAWFRFSESYEESMKLADDAAHKALGLDDSDIYIQSALTGLYVMQRQYDKAIASAERALDLGPGSARSQSSMGTALAFSCRFNEAIPFFEEAIRLDPFPPSHQFRSLGSAYSGVGRHDEALKAYEKALKLNPSDIFAHLSLAGQYVELGRDEEARAEVGEVLRLHPKFSLDYFAKTLTYKDQSVVDRRIELLRKAGLK